MASADRVWSTAVSVGATPGEALADWSTDERLAIAVPDHTRPLNPVAALEEVCSRAASAPQVVVGLGLHRKMTHAELGGLNRFGARQHDPDSVAATSVIDGVVGSVAPEFVECVGLSIGVAELHQYAGLSGGHKGIAVGCGGRETIAGLHHRDRILKSDVCVGQLEGNSFRATIDGLGHAANSKWALVWSPALKQWFFGDPEAVLKAISDQMSPWVWHERPLSQVGLIVPKAKADTLYQASRAATYLSCSPHPVLSDGGTICLEASLKEGLGSEQGFVRALQSRSSWRELLSGEAPAGAGAQRAVMLALLYERFDLVLYGVSNPDLFGSAGIEAHREALPEEIYRVSDPFNQIPQWRGT